MADLTTNLRDRQLKEIIHKISYAIRCLQVVILNIDMICYFLMGRGFFKTRFGEKVLQKVLYDRQEYNVQRYLIIILIVATLVP